MAFIFLAELFSLFGYLLPDFNNFAFLIIIFFALILSLINLEYGIWIIFAELFIGSKGYLFAFEHGEFLISIRIALWLVVMAVWFGQILSGWLKKKPKLNFNFFQLNQRNQWFYFIILFLFIAWGIVNGILNHNSFNNIFFDFNGWLYFTLIFPVYSVFKKSLINCSGTQKDDLIVIQSKRVEPWIPAFAGMTKEKSGIIKEETGMTKEETGMAEEKDRIINIARQDSPINTILQIFTASIIWLSAKTFFLLFAFSHNMSSMTNELYRWIRVTGVGEITQMQGGFYRIFFQSHIFVLIGFFIFLILLNSVIARSGNERKRMERRSNPVKIVNAAGLLRRLSLSRWGGIVRAPRNDKIVLLSVVCCLLSVVLIGFSRSNWAGLIIGLLLYYFIILLFYKIGWKKFIINNVILLCAGILSVGLIVAIVKFPYPNPTGGFNTTELLSERAGQISGEAGVSSRWALLPELWNKIKQSPILGKGFGATITYKSSDPRVLESSPTGEYTTYAFEWGWLDIWLKLGLFGLIFYLALVGKIIVDGIFRNKSKDKIIYGLTIGLVVISAVSIFSPYMNHPLGIGYLILCAALMSAIARNSDKV